MLLPRIALTPGEPAGIGPDLVIKIAQQVLPVKLVVIADKNLLLQRAKLLNLPLQIVDYNPLKDMPTIAGQLTVLHMPVAETVIAGQLNINNAEYVIATLQRAAQGCMQKEFAALVTGPVHKGVINDAGIAFSGHTEFLAQLTHTPKVLMLLAAKELKVALATTHLPLRLVPDAINTELLNSTLQILYIGLKDYFAINNPKILVCGLNPHAGEGGHIGREEIDIIIPALENLRITKNMQLIGPIPADTAFTAKHLQQADAIVAMYHDQGLPVLKHIAFDHAANITLGLPFIRTSVDHGTALELAGTNQANPGSLLVALEYALNMVKRSHGAAN